MIKIKKTEVGYIADNDLFYLLNQLGISTYMYQTFTFTS